MKSLMEGMNEEAVKKITDAYEKYPYTMGKVIAELSVSSRWIDVSRETLNELKDILGASELLIEKIN
jgi:hypothetical protein